ncbi:Aste57867_18167 [Aphanomyces stellatus]|uniref:Aste57867_18167 protein n=1 Tax=Aphanomyces stellatus TaxID=120398 RepID=A0A485LAZ3_9STRA|nr:hypothetical protein As57867_018105 [Aphanomyces stellatus]VFT94905.1 Aste57867_18167 [Aphanomyces stellatus]
MSQTVATRELETDGHIRILYGFAAQKTSAVSSRDCGWWWSRILDLSMVDILALLEECEQTIAEVEDGLKRDMGPLDALLEMANDCLVAMGCIDLEATEEPATDDDDSKKNATLVDEMQALQVLLHDMMELSNDGIDTKPKKDDGDDDDGSSETASSTASSTDSRSSPCETVNSKAKKRHRTDRQRTTHEQRVMWDCFEWTRLQTHVDRHRVARLYKQEGIDKLHIEDCTRARLETVATRHAKPAPLLPQPRPTKCYLQQFHDTPLHLKMPPRSKVPLPTSKDADILLSVYVNEDRTNMTRLVASSLDDLRAKILYKFEMDAFDFVVKETAFMRPSGLFTKFVRVRTFAQLRVGDILCAIQCHKFNNRTTPPFWLDTSKAQRAKANAKRAAVTRDATRGYFKPSPLTKETLAVGSWDYNGRAIGLSE